MPVLSGGDGMLKLSWRKNMNKKHWVLLKILLPVVYGIMLIGGGYVLWILWK